MNTLEQDNQLAERIVLVAQESAEIYLKTHYLHADRAVLFECVKSWCRVKLPEALADAKQAYEIGMNQWGQKAFFATFIQAGIEAAKEAGFPKP
jgi:hypothetical protein